MRKRILVIVSAIFIAGCTDDFGRGPDVPIYNSDDKKEKNDHLAKRVEKKSSAKNVDTKDYLYQMLLDSAHLDSMEFIADCSMYLKSGYLFKQDEKHAVIHTVNNGYSDVEIYKLTDIGWKLQYENDTLGDACDSFWMRYIDFNFDDSKDLLLRYITSNGYAVSYHYLFIYNSKKGTWQYQKEAADIAELEPNPKTRKVLGQEVIWCKDPPGLRDACRLEYEWVGNRLSLVSSKCPCEPEG